MFCMKKSKYIDQQITFALRQAETGTRVTEVCRKMRYVRADVLQLEGWEMCRRMSFERNNQKPKFYINDWHEFGCRLNLHRD